MVDFYRGHDPHKERAIEMLSQQCESNPVKNVLAADSVFGGVTDALEQLGVTFVELGFRIEEGWPRIDVWTATPAKTQRFSESFRKAVAVQVMALADVIHRGLEASLGSDWDDEVELVANVFVNVASRRISVSDVRELAPDRGILGLEDGIVL